MYKILIVEDDVTISSIIEKGLNKWGYISSRVLNFDNIMPEYTVFNPHLILMDINLPYYDGFYWCSKIRQVSYIPIIFISSRDADTDKIRAISQGGDDFIEKPFTMDLLIAKVQGGLRRAYSYRDKSLSIQQYGNMLFDSSYLKVFWGEGMVQLTPNEGKILSILMVSGGKIVTRTRLMRALWDDESFVDDNTLTVNVNRLRKKLNSLGLKGCIKTIKGEGYKLL